MQIKCCSLPALPAILCLGHLGMRAGKLTYHARRTKRRCMISVIRQYELQQPV